MTKPLNKKMKGIGEAYRPLSKVKNLSVDTPDTMGAEIAKSLSQLQKAVGDVDKFVCQKLKYKNIEEMANALAAEQVDAIALAIYNIEYKNQSLIVGDQTGVGKGRIAAGLIRYAMMNGMLPIFVTEKPSLFTDIYRDLYDIGSEDASQKLRIKQTDQERAVKYKKWAKLTEEQQLEYGSEADYLEYQEQNPTEVVTTYKNNRNYNLSIGKHVVPYIINGKEAKTDIKDSDGNILYEALDSAVQKKVLQSGKLPRGYNVVLLTYSQVQSGNVSIGDEGIELSDKARFVKKLAKNNLVILDESHNASGASIRGLALSMIIKEANCLFLSATFAKRPDNMPIYAMKTAMAEANLTSEGLSEAIKKGGVALQEVVSSQLVAEGQMIRRERTYEGIEVNYITLDEKGGSDIVKKDAFEEMYQKHYCTKEMAKKDAIRADSITQVVRDIIAFQADYINPEVQTLDSIAAASMGEVSLRKGTAKAGVDSTPYFSKVFNVINQMLFSLKAEAVADRAIMRLKQGKKPVIAFSNTMGAFIDSIETSDDDGGSVVNADFTTVLIKGLDGVLRYTVTNADNEKEYRMFDITTFSTEAQFEYQRIKNLIYQTSSGLVISPIDLIKKRITEAGYVVAEVTGRKLQVKLEQREGKVIEYKSKPTTTGTKGTKIPKLVEKIMNNTQKSIVRQSEEFEQVVLDIEKNVKGLPKLYFYEKELNRRRKEGELNLDAKQVHVAHLHYFIGGSDWYITEWDGKDTFFGYTILNNDYEYAEFGYISLSELLSYKGKFNSVIELDFYWTPATISDILGASGLGKRKKKGLGDKASNATRWVGTIMNRPAMDAKDAFWGFNNNKIDVLLLNQSGSTGTSAHAVATKLVAPKDAKQRVMIVLQSELDINVEMQKRGRINRTGQLIKPIYDYITSAIPAENRLMMMLKKKLKSLDANTSSNQKNSESILKSNDFLNKYGDRVVAEYLDDNKKVNQALGYPLVKANGDIVTDGAAMKVSGRVAILKSKDQKVFYDEVLDQYHLFVENKIESGEYDLEVEIMNLKARTIERKVIIDGKGGNSSFGTSTFEEHCEVNELKKPYTSKELIDALEKELDGKSKEAYSQAWIDKAEAFLENQLNERLREINEDYEKQFDNLKERKDVRRSSDPDKAYTEAKFALILAREDKMNLEKEKSENRLFFLSDKIFSHFRVGDIISLPEDYTHPTEEGQLGVFVGFQINEKKSNPFTNGNIRLKFFIASGKRSRTFNLSGESMQWVDGIKNAAAFGRYDFETIDYKWNAAVKRNYSERTERFILTGNLLQAFGNPKLSAFRMKLIQFSTEDGSVRKGILMPENYNSVKSKSGASNNPHNDMVNIPIGKSLKVISAMPMNKVLNTSIPLTIQRDRNLDYLFIYKPAKNSPKVHLDRNVLQFVEGNEFNKATTVFKATVVQRELESLLLCLQNNYGISLITDRYTLDSVGYEFNEGFNDDSQKQQAPEPLFVKSLLEMYNELLEL